MKAVIAEGIGKIRVKEVPDQEINEYQALVKIEACSICNGTDAALIDRKSMSHADNYPWILGHESVGTVIKTGNRVKNFKTGDRVLRPMVKVEGYGSLWGGFSELGAVTDKKAADEDRAVIDNALFHPGQQVIPGNMDPVMATQLINIKETLSFLYRAKIRKYESFLIIGTGPAGLSFAHLARKVVMANPILIIGRREEALRRAMLFGAHFMINSTKADPVVSVKKYCMKGVSLVIDTTGLADLVRAGLSLIGDKGRFASYGKARNDQESIIPLLENNKQVINIQPEESEAHKEVIRLAKDKKINPAKFITHVIPLKDIKKGFQLIKKKQALKVVVKMDA